MLAAHPKPRVTRTGSPLGATSPEIATLRSRPGHRSWRGRALLRGFDNIDFDALPAISIDTHACRVVRVTYPPLSTNGARLFGVR